MTYEAVDAETLHGDGGFWSLYGAAFPASSREPAAVIVRSIEMGVGIALRARDGGRTLGLATAHVLRSPPAVFLVYLAVAPELRGRGVGASLFRELVARGTARHGRPVGMVWEIDEGRAEDVGWEKLRRFYERLGGRVLPMPYVQPPVDGTSLIPMRLMYRPATEETPGEELVRAIYFEKYGAVNGIAEGTLRALLGSVCGGQ